MPRGRPLQEFAISELIVAVLVMVIGLPLSMLHGLHITTLPASVILCCGYRVIRKMIEIERGAT